MNSPATINDDLLRRYDRPGPRYTSYPTVPRFRDDFTMQQFCEGARAAGAPGPRALSLYVHVPFCHSPCFYCGCNRIITRRAEVGERYVARILAEAEITQALTGRTGPVMQLHLGGGTPNFLSGSSLDHLVTGLAERFTLSDRPERDFSIELDPRTIPEQPERYADRLARLGFNRVSLGVQDFDEAVQTAINRRQSPEQTLDLIDACRDHGIRSVNIDLIYGLPKQSLAGFRRTLRTVIAARPDRVAIYGYAHMPALFKAQGRIHVTELPDAGTRLALLRLATEELTAFGYRHIGMDHFSLPDDDLALAQRDNRLQRNFMGYTTHGGCDLLGLGVSAISRMGNCYGQNLKDLRSWEKAIDSRRDAFWRGLALSADDCIRASVIEQLMCHGRIDVRATERQHGLTFSSYFDDALARLRPMLADGLVVLRDDAITVTDVGRVLLRNIAMCFDRYLTQPDARPEAAARTI